jgi:hypothetical protein
LRIRKLFCLQWKQAALGGAESSEKMLTVEQLLVFFRLMSWQICQELLLNKQQQTETLCRTTGNVPTSFIVNSFESFVCKQKKCFSQVSLSEANIIRYSTRRSDWPKSLQTKHRPMFGTLFFAVRR